MLIKDVKGQVLTDVHGTPLTDRDRWHPKLQKYLTAVTKSQGNLSSILPYAEKLNQKLWQSNGNLMFLTYENSTELGMRIQTDSGQDWEVDWQGDGNWETYESSTTEQIKNFGSATSGVALFRTTNNDISEVQSTTGNWIFDISIFKGINYLYLNGSSITATGDIQHLAGANYVYFDGNSIAVTGDIQYLAGVNTVWFNGNQININYTSTTWSNAPNARLQIITISTGLTQIEVDNLLIDLSNATTIPSSGNRLIIITGNNAAPTAASLAARNALIAAGYTITTN